MPQPIFSDLNNSFPESLAQKYGFDTPREPFSPRQLSLSKDLERTIPFSPRDKSCIHGEE